jgi:flagellin
VQAARKQPVTKIKHGGFIMAIVVNSNIASLNAQRNLVGTGKMLSTSLQRLSSGLRINSAKDDAAGLAISDRMNAQVRGLNQAVRNANDGISLAQTAEGAMGEMTNIVQRMRELAVQSRNATNTDADRTSLDAEFQQLKSELDRIADTTSFNGRKVLDGSLGNSVFQVGANVGETISVDISTSMRTNSIGGYARATYQVTEFNGTDTNAEGTATKLDNAGELVINGVNVGAATAGDENGQGVSSAYAIANAINLGTSTHSVTAEAGETSHTITAAQIAAFDLTDGSTTTDTLQLTLNVNGVDVMVLDEADSTNGVTAEQIALAFNGAEETTGITASAQSDGSVILTGADGRNIEVKETLSGAQTTTDDTATTLFGNSLQGVTTNTIRQDVYKAEITLYSESSISVKEATTNDTILDDVGTAADTTTITSLETADIRSTANVDMAIYQLDVALNSIDSFRSDLGAVQNRFESTIANLMNVSENISAAKSRIVDADFAMETAALTKAQILQQAGLAMLAQANTVPQAALTLLQG